MKPKAKSNLFLLLFTQHVKVLAFSTTHLKATKSLLPFFFPFFVLVSSCIFSMTIIIYIFTLYYMYVSSIHTSKYMEKGNTIFTITQTQEKT
jgi:hypothetical protein